MKDKKDMPMARMCHKIVHIIHSLSFHREHGHITGNIMVGGGTIRYQSLIMKNHKSYMIIL